MRFIYRFLFGPPSVDKAANKISSMINKSAFKIFRDRKVRSWLEFEDATEQEQDRIFNELIVTGYALAILMTNTLTKYHEDEFQKFLEETKLLLEHSYQDILRSLEAEEYSIKMWDELIKMRINEYLQEYADHRNELPDIDEDNPWILVTAVGGFDHITRGQGKPRDPLFGHLLRWLMKVSYDINGIYISNLKRI